MKLVHLFILYEFFLKVNFLSWHSIAGPDQVLLICVPFLLSIICNPDMWFSILRNESLYVSECWHIYCYCGSMPPSNVWGYLVLRLSVFHIIHRIPRWGLKWLVIYIYRFISYLLKSMITCIDILLCIYFFSNCNSYNLLQPKNLVPFLLFCRFQGSFGDRSLKVGKHLSSETVVFHRTLKLNSLFSSICTTVAFGYQPNVIVINHQGSLMNEVAVIMKWMASE